MKLRRSTKVTVFLALITYKVALRQKNLPKRKYKLPNIWGIGRILLEYREKTRTLEVQVNEAAKSFDLREKENPTAARLELADSMERLLEQTKPYLSAIERLSPPEKLREHHAVNVECPRTQANSLEQMVRALRNFDRHSYAMAMEQGQKSMQDCPERIRVTLQKGRIQLARRY